MIITAKKCPPQTRKSHKNENCQEADFLSPDILNDSDDSDSGKGEFLLCFKCLRIVTSTAEKIKVNGSYNHSFANPYGLFFDIACFKNAPGCSYSGTPSAEFTWFMGFSWKIAVCRDCMNHLGWLFSSTKSSFHGLIPDRLILSRS